jgi:hypothetical protein
MNFKFSRALGGIFLFASAVFARDGFSPRQIEAALEDGLYPLAEQQLRKQLDQSHPPQERAEPLRRSTGADQTVAQASAAGRLRLLARPRPL